MIMIVITTIISIATTDTCIVHISITNIILLLQVLPPLPEPDLGVVMRWGRDVVSNSLSGGGGRR